MIKRDYYEVLGVDRRASNGDIKSAYRRLALQYHPDRNPGDPEAEERFKEASEAYEVLCDARRRDIYDAYGHRGLEGAGFHGFTDIGDIFGSMGDIFEEFFGAMGGMGSRARRRARAGADMRFDLTISFMEAAKGVEKEISITRVVACETCEGTGQEPGTGKQVCRACGGTGQITQRQGFFVLQTTCPQCRGAGSRIDKPCKGCRGAGRVSKHERIKVKVPAGIENGMQLVLRGKGHEGEPGAPAGNLFVYVSVTPHDLFERAGEDIAVTVPISFPQAALGDEIEVPGLDGEISVKIPAGTDSGDEVRIRGGGLPSVHHGGKGDEVVRFVVKTPKKLSKKQREMLKRFMQEE
jgi:molecular chaperone DnaJ